MPPKDTGLAEYEIQLKALQGTFKQQLDTKTSEVINMENLTPISYFGAGGYGTVFSVGTDDRRFYAVKLQERAALSRSAAIRARDEKRFLVAMDSPLIVEVRGTFRDPVFIYLYMDIAVFGDLHRVLGGHPLGEDKAKKFAAQMVCALEYIHACSLIYRDMKPANCLIFRDGRLKIADFGLSCLAEGPGATGLMGTTPYLAPEICNGEVYNSAVDWWALGITIYEMLLARKPFSESGESKGSVKKKVLEPLVGLEESGLTPEANDIIARLLEKNPKDRLGCFANGARDVKSHDWFRNIHFYDVLFGEVQIENHNFLPYRGRRIREIDILELETVPRGEGLGAHEDVFKDY